MTGAGRFAAVDARSHHALFSDEHEQLRAEVRLFVEKELVPYVPRWEKEEAFPREVFVRLGELGLLGLKFSPRFGGEDDIVADAVVTEELARCGSGGVAAAVGAHKDLAALYLARFGSDEQQERWLRPSLEGTLIGALALTEPDVGSDLAALKTTARRDGNDWILSGTKTFVTNGAWADFLVVGTNTGSSSEDRDLTLFLVEPDAAGVTRRRIRTLGWRPSQTGEVHLDAVRIPDSHRLGQEGSGFYAIMRSFGWERLVMALSAVSAAAMTYEVAKKYALERTAFGRPVGKFQVWRHRFAEMATRIEAARALTYNALRLVAEGEEAREPIAMAKLYSTRIALEVADECVQIHGGYGYATEFSAERALRDAQLAPIGGGTSEIMREIIGRGLGI